jgi:hypothetical protein
MKRAIWVLAITITMLTFSACGGDDAVEARTMVVHRVEGPTVRLTRAEGQTANAMAGTRLNAGDAMATEAASFGYILLDSASLVRVEEHSRVIIDQATDRLLSIIVESGQIHIDVQGQSPGHTIETRVGNVVFGVRGTAYSVRHDTAEGVASIEVERGVVVATNAATGAELAVLTGGDIADFDAETAELIPPYTIEGNTVTLRRGSLTFKNISDGSLIMNVNRVSGRFMRVRFDENGRASSVGLSLNANHIGTVPTGSWYTVTVLEDGGEAVFTVTEGSIGTALSVTHSHAPVLTFVRVNADEQVAFTSTADYTQTIGISEGTSRLTSHFAADGSVERFSGTTASGINLSAGQRWVGTPALEREYVVYYVPTALIGTSIIIERLGG